MFSDVQQRQLSVDSRIEDIQIRSIVFQGQSFHTECCAMILHTMLDNWAFVRYSTLKHSLQTDSDFFQMGNTTLFIEELSSLSILEQLILSRFLQKASLDSEIPVIVFEIQLCSNDDWRRLQPMESIENHPIENDPLKSRQQILDPVAKNTSR